jgi:hypothetical protein
MAGAEGLMWLLVNFVAFTALHYAGFELAPDVKNLIVILVEVVIGLSCLWMWMVRGMLSHNIDMILAESSPTERAVIAARIQAELDKPQVITPTAIEAPK